MRDIRKRSRHEASEFPSFLKAGFAFLILLELIAPFVIDSYGPDGGFHIYWIQQFTKLVSEGVFFPRWTPESFWGFGSPSFYFYPPLTYYLASLIRLISGFESPAALFQAVSLVATICSFFTALMLLRAIGGRGLRSAVGAALYAFAPYRLAEIYSLSSLSSHVGFIFLPLVWSGLFLMSKSNSPSRNGMLLFAASFAMMTLSNIPLTALTIVTMILAAVVFRRKISASVAGGVAIGLVIAALLASFYLISVISYAPYAQLGYLTKQHEFFLDDLTHFSNLPGLYHLALLYLAIAAIVMADSQIRKKKEPISAEERALLRIGLAITILLIVLEIPAIGRPVFSYVPVIELVQGTWRFYIDIVLLASCIVGIASSAALQRAAKQIIGIWIAGAMFPMALILMNIHISAHQQTQSTEPPEYAPIYTLKDHGKLESALSHLNNMAPIVTGSRDGESVIIPIVNGPNREEYSVNFGSPSTVTFHRFYWPAWRLYTNGREILSRPDSLGRAVANFPAGQYRAVWQLERSPLEDAGIWISGIAWAGLAAVSGISLARRYVKGRRPPQQ